MTDSKRGNTGMLKLLLGVSGYALLAVNGAQANPLDPTVVSGNVAFNGLGTANVIVDSGSMQSIINWDSFSIGVGETTTFNQVSDQAAVLNRVVGGNLTEIYGQLLSNGQIYLINENGILIGETGLVDTNGFVASTLELSNNDFLGAGDMLFRQGIENGGGITVHGRIRSIGGGDVFLLSREIEIGEKGSIQTGGYVGLGAGEEILLKPTDAGDGRITIRAGKGRIINRGTIEGTAAELRAAGGNAYALAINNTGVVRATGVSRSGGRVLLTAGGTIRNTGRVESRKKVVVRSTKRIENKGTIRVRDTVTRTGGKIVFEAPEILVETGSVLDVSAALGGGRIFVGGGFQGGQTDRAGIENVEIASNAQRVTVQSGALLDASATESGKGGEVIIWSDGTTAFAGDIKAVAASGKGGFAEVSGKEGLVFAGVADLRGSAGLGDLLLDPITLTVVDGPVDTLDDAGLGDFQILAGDAEATITDAKVASQLTTANVTLQASGVIMFAPGVEIKWEGQSLLTVEAPAITALDDVIIQHTERYVDLGTAGLDAGDQFVTGNGGVYFNAAGAITIGTAGPRTGGVAIGSEFGRNDFVAGAAVTVTGGNTIDGYAQVGYQVGAERGGDGQTNNIDYADASGARAANGDINVTAGLAVTVAAGSTAFPVGDAGLAPTSMNFAQIGHGGAPTDTGATVSVADISGDINVTAGAAVAVQGALNHGDPTEYAQIGHGSALATSTGQNLRQGNITGNITVEAIGGVTINGLPQTPTTPDGVRNYQLAQVGHGGTGVIVGGTLSASTDPDYAHGKIQGDINVNAGVGVIVGSIQADSTTNLLDTHTVQSQLGHGAHGYHVTGLSPVEVTLAVSGDDNVHFAYNDIAPFEDVAGRVLTTDITLRGLGGVVPIAAVMVNANESLESAQLFGSDVVDNIQRAQIGSGSSTYVGTNLDLPLPVSTTGSALDVVVDEGRITGDIDIDTLALTLTSSITSHPQRPAASFDYVAARIGHGNMEQITTLNGGVGLDGGDITINQSHVLAANIDINAAVFTVTSGIVTAPQSVLMTGNTAITQIGHGSDTLLRTGAGGAGAAGLNAGNGGDVLISKGTVWDGFENEGRVDYYGGIDNTNITLTGGALAITSTNSVTAQAGSTSNVVHAAVGHGSRNIISTGDGGWALDGNNGGRGGDVEIIQSVDGRDLDGGVLKVTSANADEITSDINQIGRVNPTTGRVYRVLRQTNGNLYEMPTLASGATAAAIANYNSLAVVEDPTVLDPASITTDITLIGTYTAGGVLIRYFEEAVAGDTADFIDADDYHGGDNVSGRGDVYDVYALLQSRNTSVSTLGDGTNEDTATGIRGDIRINVAAVSVLSNVTTGAQAVGDHEGAYSLIGHGDYAEIYSGDGGIGGAAVSATDAAQVEAHGGRGGHISADLRNQLIEGDIAYVPTIAGAVAVTSTILHPSMGTLNFSISEANIGHGSNIAAHAGDGALGGSANHLANAATSLATAQSNEAFLGDLRGSASGHGAATGGNGGDVFVALGEITDRRITDRYTSANVYHNDEADIVLSNVLATTVSSVLTPSVPGTGNSDDIYSGIGHHHRIYAEGGIGGIGGSSTNQFDGNPNDATTPSGDVFIQPDVSGGRGGDALVSSGNIRGDIVIDGGPVAVTTPPTAGVGGFQKVISQIGHTTDLIAVTQNGGAAGILTNANGGIVTNVEDAGAGNISVSQISLVDGNDDDALDLNNYADGVDLSFTDYNGGEPDGQAETVASLDRILGSNPTDRFHIPENESNTPGYNGTVVGDNVGGSAASRINPGDTDDVIFHDVEADPEYILVTALADNATQVAGEVNSAGHVIGTFVRNYNGDTTTGTEDNGMPIAALNEYRNSASNVSRYGRVVGQYDARFENKLDVARYVDLDQNGTVDLVDFNSDGKFDVVDIDQDGRYDQIDGRADYVAGAHGVLDYTAVTGTQFDAAHLEGGWTLRNTVSTDNVLGAAGFAGLSNKATQIVGDFSNANGGRGGDAYVHAGTTVGDIVIDAVGAVAVTSGTTTEPIEHIPGLFDLAVAQIGHGGYHWADTSANYALRSSGRADTAILRDHTPDLIPPGVGHLPALGGLGGLGAINASGGRGGDASVLEGAARDVDASLVNSALENDYLVGRVLINVPDFDTDGVIIGTGNSSSYAGLDPTGYATGTGSAGVGESWRAYKEGKPNDDGQVWNADSVGDHIITSNLYADATQFNLNGLRGGLEHADLLSGAVTVTALGATTGTNTTVVSQIGHGGLSYATAGNWLGNVLDLRNQMGIVSTNLGGVGALANDVSEIANGGRGGDASIMSYDIKGETRIDTIAALTVSSGLTATPRAVSGLDTIISQIGHGGIQTATGGLGALGGDGEWSANGGRGGDVNITTGGTRDAEINLNVGGVIAVTAAHAPAVTSTGINNIISAKIGAGDWSFAEGGFGAAGGIVLGERQFNETANGGRGGDVVIEQGGYNGDINAQVLGLVTVSAIEGAGPSPILPNQFMTAAIGHGGQAIGLSEAGGGGGIIAAATLVDDINHHTTNDMDNFIDLRGDANAGRGGNVDVNVGVGGTGVVTGNRTTGNYYGVTDNDGSDIHIQAGAGVNVMAAAAQTSAEVPDVAADPLGAPVRTIDGLTAVIGHASQARANGVLGLGGLAIGIDVSEANGGDGGDARATTGFVQGDIVIDTTILNVGAPTGDVATLPGGALPNYIVESRVGHIQQAEALAGSGGLSAGTATLSARGGDSGTAIVLQDRIWGDINIEANASVSVLAMDNNPMIASSPVVISSIGHRAEAKAISGLLAGLSSGSIIQSKQSLYFTYDALLEFKQRTRTIGGDLAAAQKAAFNQLSALEQKLVAPFYSSAEYKANVDSKSAYFDDKYMGHFLDKLLVGARDDNNIEDTGAVGYEFAAFDGADHVGGPNDAGAGFNGATVDNVGSGNTTNVDRIFLNGSDDSSSVEGSESATATNPNARTLLGRDADNGTYDGRSLVGNNVNNQSTRYEIGALSNAEVDALVAVMLQGGDGGHAAIVQGGMGAGAVAASPAPFHPLLDILNPNQDINAGIGAANVSRSVAGEIHIDSPLITVAASANGVAVTDPAGFQSASIGHQAEVLQARAHDGAVSIGGIGGDGGDVGVIQEAFEGNIELVGGAITITSTYTGAASLKNQYARVGHRLNIGHDYALLRPGLGADTINPVVHAGNGGSGKFAGNGGNIAVVQNGVVANWNDHDADGIADSADVDVLNNGDQDGDGIDDIADATYNTGSYNAGSGTFGDSAGDTVGARGASGADGIKDSFNDKDGDFNDADADGIEDSADVDLIGGGDVDGDGVSDYADVRFNYTTAVNSNAGGTDRNGFIDESFARTDGGDGIVDAFNDTDGTFNDADGDRIEDSADVDVLKNGDHDLDGIDDLADADFRGYTHNDREMGGQIGVNRDTMLVLELRDAGGLVRGDINVSALDGVVLDRDETNNNALTGTVALAGEDVEIVGDSTSATFKVIYDGTTGKFYAVQYDTVTTNGTATRLMVKGAEYTDSRIIERLTRSELVVVGDLLADADQNYAFTSGLNTGTGIVSGTGTTDAATTIDGYNTNRGRFEIGNIDARYGNGVVDRYEVNISDRDNALADNTAGFGSGVDGARSYLVADTGAITTGINAAVGASYSNLVSESNANYTIQQTQFVGRLVDQADGNFRVNGTAGSNIDNVAATSFSGTVSANQTTDSYVGYNGILAGYDNAARADGANPIRNSIVINAQGIGTVIINSNSTTGLGAQETETQIGHELIVVSAKAGDGALISTASVHEGLLEANGGDISVRQGDLGGDINIYGETAVSVTAVAVAGLGANYVQTHIGHERTIGLDGDRHATLIPLQDAYEGSIRAGMGGTTTAEDYNDTAEIEPYVALAGFNADVINMLGTSGAYGSLTSTSFGTASVEDGDGGNVSIQTGTLGGAANVSNREQVVLARNPAAQGTFETDIAIAIDSHGAVLISNVATAGLGLAQSRINIGMEQHGVATAGAAGLSAGDGGNVVLNRGAISGDIVAQALGGGAVTVTNLPVAGLGLALGDLQIGHENEWGHEFETNNPQAALLFAQVAGGNGGTGVDQYATLRDALVGFLYYKADGTGLQDNTTTSGESIVGRVTMTETSEAVDTIDNMLRAVTSANQLAGRYAPEDQARLTTALATLTAASTSAHAAVENNGISLDQQIDAVQTAARNALNAFAIVDTSLGKTQAELNQIMATSGTFVDNLTDARTAANDLTNGTQRALGTTSAGVLTGGTFWAENASLQLADHADGGDVLYGVANTHFNFTNTPANEGLMTGNVRLIAGIDNESANFNLGVDPNTSDPVQNLYGDNDALQAPNDFTQDGNDLRADTLLNRTVDGRQNVDRGDGLLGAQDDYSLGLVSVTSIATSGAAAALADTQIGHRGRMNNASGIGGLIASEGGHIQAANTTNGDVTLTAAATVVVSDAVIPLAGNYAELQFLHDEEMLNVAGASLAGFGDGGDIVSGQTVTGGFELNTNLLNAGLQTFGAGVTGTGTRAVLIAGHQADSVNISQSTVIPYDNRGGTVNATQIVRGTNDADGDVIANFNMDLDENGNPTDLIIQTFSSTGILPYETRVGSEAELFAVSGMSIHVPDVQEIGTPNLVVTTGSGNAVTAVQTISGDVEMDVEDLAVRSLGLVLLPNVYLGHDGVSVARSGSTLFDSYGGVVNATQTINGDLNLDPTRSFEVSSLSLPGGEAHVGHSGAQTAESADDDRNGTNDSAANPIANEQAPGRRATDVVATQVIDADVSIVTGQITVLTAGLTGFAHLGHEAYQTLASQDTGYIVATSDVNPTSNIILTTLDPNTLRTGILPATPTHTIGEDLAFSLAQPLPILGDLSISNLLTGESQIGHRSVSTVNASGNDVLTARADTQQRIGGAGAGGDVIVTVHHDLTMNSGVGGTAQLGHYITETGALLPGTVNAATGSNVDQIVNSNILIGDNSATTGVGSVEGAGPGIGNNLSMTALAGGRTEIGHRSPAGNNWQAIGTEVITDQLLGGNILVEVGTNAARPMPDGVAALSTGDDALILSLGGVARIGHNHADVSDIASLVDGLGGIPSLNQVQRSQGDIWLEVGADLHVVNGAVGHEHYDFLGGGALG